MSSSAMYLFWTMLARMAPRICTRGAGEIAQTGITLSLSYGEEASERVDDEAGRYLRARVAASSSTLLILEKRGDVASKADLHRRRVPGHEVGERARVYQVEEQAKQEPEKAHERERPQHPLLLPTHAQQAHKARNEHGHGQHRRQHRRVGRGKPYLYRAKGLLL